MKQQLLLDRELEKAKIDLMDTCQDFNLHDAFRLIDREGRGYITAYEIMHAFKDQERLDLPQFTSEDIELIIYRYDRNRDKRIRFSEFIQAFSPTSDAYLADKLLARKRNVTGFLSDKTRYMYRSLWLTQVKVE